MLGFKIGFPLKFLLVSVDTLAFAKFLGPQYVWARQGGGGGMYIEIQFLVFLGGNGV